MPCSLAPNLVVRQLHGSQRRDEQLGNADHVVVAEDGDIVGNFQATPQQQLIGTKGDTVVATDQNIELGTTINDMPVEDGGCFTVGIMIGKVVLQERVRRQPECLTGTLQAFLSQPPMPDSVSAD